MLRTLRDRVETGWIMIYANIELVHVQFLEQSAIN